MIFDAAIVTLLLVLATLLLCDSAGALFCFVPAVAMLAGLVEALLAPNRETEKCGWFLFFLGFAALLLEVAHTGVRPGWLDERGASGRGED